MGMFNRLLAPEERVCPDCGVSSQRWMQFAYGATNLASYRVGEILSWDVMSTAEGEPGLPRVGVQGVGACCPHCHGDDDLEYDLVIKNDVIESAVPSTGEIDYLSQDNYYWVVLPDS